MREAPRVGVVGASSLVGRFLVPLVCRRAGGVLACSRTIEPVGDQAGTGVLRHQTGAPLPPGLSGVPAWITLCPLWVVPNLRDWLERMGAEHIVALSSMSTVSRASSPDPADRQLAATLAAAEDELVQWTTARGIAFTLLVPTMIYDGTNDGNVAAIAAWVRRFGWFPLCGPARGLRQPVHAGDVAAACLAAIECPPPRDRYALSGGEALPFRELVVRTCRAHGLAPRTASLPPWLWNIAIAAARKLGLAGPVTSGLGWRMNADLSCDHAAAAAELGFRPRPFVPGGGTLGAMEGVVSVPPTPPRGDR